MGKVQMEKLQLDNSNTSGLHRPKAHQAQRGASATAHSMPRPGLSRAIRVTLTKYSHV